MSIEGLKWELVAAIQSESVSKRHLWCKIPRLALLADGLTGWSDGSEYKLGIIKLKSGLASYYDLTLDLSSGLISNWDKLASVRALLAVVIPDPQELIDYYEGIIKSGPRSYTDLESYNKNINTWGARIGDQYVRLSPIPTPTFVWE